MYNLSTTTTTTTTTTITTTSTTNGISTLLTLEMYTYSFMFLDYRPNLETQTSLAMQTAARPMSFCTIRPEPQNLTFKLVICAYYKVQTTSLENHPRLPSQPYNPVLTTQTPARPAMFYTNLLLPKAIDKQLI